MRLNQRIARLEHALGEQPCVCEGNADLAWPGHQPDPHCRSCGGRRFIYPLNHHPAESEAQMRAALPLLAKTYDGHKRVQLDRLTDNELRQLRAALLAAGCN
jgi:hypothetical protein